MKEATSRLTGTSTAGRDAGAIELIEQSLTDPAGRARRAKHVQHERPLLYPLPNGFRALSVTDLD